MQGAIVVPYRNRKEHLDEFLPHYAKKQMDIYVMEQSDDKPFNRGKLANVWYNMFSYKYDYFIFHDVDNLDEYSDYSYCPNVCQLATGSEQFGYKMPYHSFLGCVTLFPCDKFKIFNGFPNTFWAYGGEDDEVYRRVREKDLIIEYRDCRYRSLPHERIIDHKMRMNNAFKLHQPIDWTDGLNLCEYSNMSIQHNEQYTHVKVQL